MSKYIRFLAALVVACSALGAHADSYPSKPVRIIVPFSPGGTVDIVGRVLAQKLTEQLGQQFIVENRAGAAGVLGSEAAAKASPDGYTLLVQAPTLIANPLILKKVPYDTAKDFTPISLLGSVPMVVAASPRVQASNLREFIAMARANPQDYTFGSSALGSPMHIAQEAIKHDARLNILIVTYKGTANAINDLLGGQISAIIDAIPSTYPHIASGKLKALAVTTKARIPALPNVPTVEESGLPGFEMVSWYGLWGPGKLPEDITKLLASETAKAMRSSLAAERLGSHSFVAVGSTSQEFAKYIEKEAALYGRIVNEANIRAE